MSNGNWEKIYASNGEVQTEVLNTVVEAVELFTRRGHKDILDLGCGTGRNTIYLADKGFKVSACDLSETGLEITKKKAEELGLNNIDYSIEDMYHLNYQDEIFDGVLCVWVQGHGTRREIQMGIQEIYRVLKEDGSVVTDFVTIEDPTYGIGEAVDKNTFVGGRVGEEGIPHYYTTQEEIEKMFGQFSMVDIYDRTYTFKDDQGQEHEIVAIVVSARK